MQIIPVRVSVFMSAIRKFMNIMCTSARWLIFNVQKKSISH